jgi:stearoyl-CoA desaturase (delta-9 desaturase)
VLTAAFAIAPLVTAVILIVGGVGGPIPWFEIALMAVFAVLVGHGVTIGYHRLFTHRSFEARRPLKIVLASLGSMSFQGSLIGWVADHRRHHRFADRPGDPHSPLVKDEQELSGLRGLWHAHLGWCFTNKATSRERYAPDLLADRDLVIIDRLFIPFCVATLIFPFAIGFVWSGTLAGAVAAFLWAGLLRVGLTHNFTWSINSFCHRFGKRPYPTKDASTNLAVLAPFTMGESWHNNHHAFPRSARHGLDRGQVDSSARIIRWFEQLGWATNVNWPDAAQLAARRVRV